MGIGGRGEWLDRRENERGGGIGDWDEEREVRKRDSESRVRVLEDIDVGCSCVNLGKKLVLFEMVFGFSFIRENGARMNV